MADHIIGALVGGISKGIAVTSELAAGKKGRDSAQARRDFEEGKDPNVVEDDPTSVDWALDDISREIEPEEETAVSTLQHQQIVPASIQPLSKSILIPQRRPGERTRGFVKAYPPSLALEKGINEQMFLDFLTSLNLSSRTSPVFDVLNLAAFALGMTPEAICQAISIVLGAAAQIGQTVEGRYRNNVCLEKANNEIFRPRNCFAMIMTYKPDLTEDAILQVDTSATQIALSKSSVNQTGIRKYFSRMKSSAGSTTENQIPEYAPLTYPSIDRALASTDLTDKNNSSLTNNKEVLADYLDRRAQTNFSLVNPNSKLTSALPPQSKPYVNRYADPNHRVNSGSIFGLLTGGTFDPISQGRVLRAEMSAKRSGEPPLSDSEKHDAYMGRKVRGRVTGTPSKQIPLLGGLMKKDVLYLVIVEMPTEAQLQVTMAALAANTEQQY